MISAYRLTSLGLRDNTSTSDCVKNQRRGQSSAPSPVGDRPFQCRWETHEPLRSFKRLPRMFERSHSERSPASWVQTLYRYQARDGAAELRRATRREGGVPSRLCTFDGGTFCRSIRRTVVECIVPSRVWGLSPPFKAATRLQAENIATVAKGSKAICLQTEALSNLEKRPRSTASAHQRDAHDQCWHEIRIDL